MSDRTASRGAAGRRAIQSLCLGVAVLATSITAAPSGGVDPSWSPNGTRIAFSAYRGGLTGFEIYIAAVGQTEQAYTERLVTDQTDFRRAFSPDRSPAGHALVFLQNDDGWQINTDGIGS